MGLHLFECRSRSVSSRASRPQSPASARLHLFGKACSWQCPALVESAASTSERKDSVTALCRRRLTIRSSRDRFAASAEYGNLGICQGRKAVRLNSGVSAAQRFLAQQSGSRFGVTSGQISDPSSLAALVFSSNANSNSAVLRSALVSTSRLVLRGGANNSFKPTPLRGAA